MNLKVGDTIVQWFWPAAWLPKNISCRTHKNVITTEWPSAQVCVWESVDQTDRKIDPQNCNFPEESLNHNAAKQPLISKVAGFNSAEFGGVIIDLQK